AVHAAGRARVHLPHERRAAEVLLPAELDVEVEIRSYAHGDAARAVDEQLRVHEERAARVELGSPRERERRPDVELGADGFAPRAVLPDAAEPDERPGLDARGRVHGAAEREIARERHAELDRRAEGHLAGGE